MAATDAATETGTETATDAGTGTGAILDDRRERRRLPLVGLVLSALYVAGVTLYLFVQGQNPCLLYTSPSPRDATLSRMPSSA